MLFQSQWGRGVALRTLSRAEKIKSPVNIMKNDPFTDGKQFDNVSLLIMNFPLPSPRTQQHESYEVIRKDRLGCA